MKKYTMLLLASLFMSPFVNAMEMSNGWCAPENASCDGSIDSGDTSGGGGVSGGGGGGTGSTDHELCMLGCDQDLNTEFLNDCVARDNLESELACLESALAQYRYCAADCDNRYSH
ncbi:hypothetical protein [Methylomonas sp. AM2-LC]|uniref:hypothetical protein n=1 Tax=Methylomonas sp. AM2-LC TaxID=3153301 RepID=UPI0032677F17